MGKRKEIDHQGILNSIIGPAKIAVSIHTVRVAASFIQIDLSGGGVRILELFP